MPALLVDGLLPAGVYAQAVTPLNRDGSIDMEAWRGFILHLASAGVGVYVAGTGYGEGQLMSEQEIFGLYDFSAKTLKGKVPIVAANLEHATAAQAAAFAHAARESGVDAVQVYPVTPGHEIVPTPEMLDDFYQRFFSQVTMPVMVSSARPTGFEVPMATHARLLDLHPQIAGFNKFHPSAANVAQFVDLVGARRPVFTEHINLPISLAFGAKGLYGYLPNVAPYLCRAYFDAFQAGDMRRANEHFTVMVRLANAIREARPGAGIGGSALPATKAALEHLGLMKGHVRLPYIEFDAVMKKKVARAVDEFELRRIEGL